MNVHSWKLRDEMKRTAKRDDIIKASLDLIAEHGFHGAPIALIAEKAGVGAGTIYRYFDSKDVLIAELYRELEEEIVSTLQEGCQEEKSVRDRYIFMCRKLLEYLITHPLNFRFMEQYFNSPYGISLRRDKIIGKNDERNAFERMFEEGISRQVLKDLPVYVLAALTFSPIVSLVRDHTLGLISLDGDVIAKSIDACWDGIKR